MNNPHLTLAGTGDFSLILGATAVPSAEADYDATTAMFGNLKEVTILNEHEVKEHFGSYRGVRILDRVATTQVRKGYKLKLDEVEARALMSLFYASQGVNTGGAPDYETFVPFGAPQLLRGMGRIRLWDTQSETDPRLIHKDFYAVVRFEGDLTLGDDFAEYELRVDLLSPVGTVYLRQDA